MAVSYACTRVTRRWRGSRADALRQALGMTKESFADYLGISARTVAYWRKQADMVPQREKQDILDTAFERASDHVKEHFALLVDEQNDSFGGERGLGVVPRQFPDSDAACVPADADDAVTLLDSLAGADITHGAISRQAMPINTSTTSNTCRWQHRFCAFKKFLRTSYRASYPQAGSRLTCG
jgi:transcriptional regulator with XRE-family HTH domain